VRSGVRDDLARSAVILAVGSVLAFVVVSILKRAWHDLDCGDAHTLVLDAVITTMAVLAGASVVVGLVAIVSRTRVRRSLAMVVLATFVFTLVFLPSSSFRVDLATYNCGSEVT